MKYLVIQYKDGKEVKRAYTVAKSHKGALANLDSYWIWNHALVVNENHIARRYEKRKRWTKTMLLRDVPLVFKTNGNSKPALLILVGRYAELHFFDKRKERDHAYEICTTLDLAEYAESDKAPSDIIASLDGTLDSKSGSTSKKILNGSAVPVTWMAGLTHFSTAASSGSNSAKNSAKDTWLPGSAPFPSKRNQTFAIVKTLPRHNDYPGVNDRMKEKEGQVVNVTKTKKGLWSDGHWFYRENWLRFMRTVALGEKKFKIGKRWLEFKKYKRGIFVGGASQGITFLDSMKPWLGKVCHFENTHGNTWKMRESGYLVSDNWINFDYKSPKVTLTDF